MRLDGTHFFSHTPHLPPLANHLCIVIPFINNMGESLHYLLDRVSVSLLLGGYGTKNTLTLQYLAYLIYNTVESLHATLPPHHPFPPELTKKFTSRLNIGNLIGIKKSDSTNHPNPPTPSPSTAPYDLS
jgi:hypothetical protein